MENFQEENKTELEPAQETVEPAEVSPVEEEKAPAETEISPAETGADGQQEEKPQPTTPTFSYFIRILCGGYLVYLSYGLFTGDGAEKTIIRVAAAIFALVGIFLVIISVKGLLKKKD